MKMCSRRAVFRSGAFSLLEILAAVAILAILVAILVPAWGSYQRSALSIRCISNLRQLGTAFTTYAAENNGMMPPAYANPGVPGAAIGERVWYQYLMFQDILTKKGDGVLPNPNWSRNPGDGRNRKDVLTVYNCPANPLRLGRWETPNYAYSRGFGLYQEANGDTFKPARLAALERPGRTVVLVDAGERTTSGLSAEDGPSKSLCYITAFEDSTFYWQRSVNFDVHGGRANFLLADGHVESLSTAEVEERGSGPSPTLLWSRDNSARRSSYW